jgi:hypothetical protein
MAILRLITAFDKHRASRRATAAPVDAFVDANGSARAGLFQAAMARLINQAWALPAPQCSPRARHSGPVLATRE